MSELTPFQIKCESALNTSLAQVGARVSDRQVLGEHERYIKAKIVGTNLEIYIYEDEAQVQGPEVDARFEAPDFKTADLLCDAFGRRAVELAKNAIA